MLVPASGGGPEDLPGTGIVLGVVSEAVYEDHAVEVRAGDTLVTFTDGLTEVTDARNRFLERAGLMEQIRAHSRAATADAMARGVFEYVTRYGAGGRHRDDMTLLVVRITAPDLASARRRTGA